MATNPILRPGSGQVSLFPPACAAQTVCMEPEFLIRDRDCTVAYAAPAAFLSWLHRARADQVCIYARASMLSRREPIAATVRLVADGGLVVTWQARPHALLPFHYFARRTSKPGVQVLPARNVPRGLNADQAAVLSLIEVAADRGDRCPSNSEIALQLGLPRGSVGNILTHLEGLGLIRRHVARNFDRVVEIVETGARTAGFIAL